MQVRYIFEFAILLLFVAQQISAQPLHFIGEEFRQCIEMFFEQLNYPLPESSNRSKKWSLFSPESGTVEDPNTPLQESMKKCCELLVVDKKNKFLKTCHKSGSPLNIRCRLNNADSNENPLSVSLKEVCEIKRWDELPMDVVRFYLDITVHNYCEKEKSWRRNEQECTFKYIGMKKPSEAALLAGITMLTKNEKSSPIHLGTYCFDDREYGVFSINYQKKTVIIHGANIMDVKDFNRRVTVSEARKEFEDNFSGWKITAHSIKYISNADDMTNADDRTNVLKGVKNLLSDEGKVVNSIIDGGVDPNASAANALNELVSDNSDHCSQSIFFEMVQEAVTKKDMIHCSIPDL